MHILWPDQFALISLLWEISEFHPKLIGLTGSPDEIRNVARAYRVYYMKTAEEDSDYLVDHSIVMYVLAFCDSFFLLYFSGLSLIAFVQCLFTIFCVDQVTRYQVHFCCQFWSSHHSKNISQNNFIILYSCSTYIFLTSWVLISVWVTILNNCDVFSMLCPWLDFGKSVCYFIRKRRMKGEWRKFFLFSSFK